MGVWALGNGEAETSSEHGPPHYNLPPSGGNSTHHGHPPFFTTSPANQRILDPKSAELLTNATRSQNIAADFEALWTIVADTRKRENITVAHVYSWWEELKIVQTRLAPLTAKSCLDTAGCIGVDISTQACICKSSEAIIV